MNDQNLSKTNKSRKAMQFLNDLLAWVVSIHVAFFVIFWFLNPSLADSTNVYLADMLKLNLPYILIFQIIFGLTGIWAIFRLVISGIKFKHTAGEVKSPLKLLTFSIFSVIFLILFYASYLIIFALDPPQKGVMLQFLDFIRIFGDLFLLILAVVIIRKPLKALFRREATPGWLMLTTKILGLLLFMAIWALPILFPPGYVYKGQLPAKPGILAHRGASMIAPENTLIAADLAAQLGAYGFESDVRISKDGIAFIMHDETLQRTTNVDEVFPGRDANLAEDFTLDELKDLNAGWWFILQDPFGTVKEGVMPQSTVSQYQEQQIPTLEEVLQLVKKNGMVLMYDLRLPDPVHPYYPNAFNRVYELIQSTGTENQVWLILDADQAANFRTKGSEITRVSGLSSDVLIPAGKLAAQDYQVVNVDKGIRNADISAYHQAGLKVNIYVVDEPWLFSQFWLKGVDSITSNAIHKLALLNSPQFDMPFTQYIIFWSILGIILALWLQSGLSKPRKQPEPTLVDAPPSMDAPPVAQPVMENVSTDEINPPPAEELLPEDPVELSEVTHEEPVSPVEDTSPEVAEPPEVEISPEDAEPEPPASF